MGVCQIDINTEKIKPYSFYNNFYHELTHSFDHHGRVRRANTKEVPDKESDLATKSKIDYHYKEIEELQGSNNDWESTFGQIYYRFWNDPERNALASSVFALLKTNKPKNRQEVLKMVDDSQAVYLLNHLEKVLIHFSYYNVPDFWLMVNDYIKSPYNEPKAIKNFFIKRTNFLSDKLKKKIQQITDTYLMDLYDEKNKKN